MLDKFQRFWRHHVIQGMPVDLAACEYCGAGRCLEEKWLTCPNRLIQKERETVHRWMTLHYRSAPP